MRGVIITHLPMLPDIGVQTQIKFNTLNADFLGSETLHFSDWHITIFLLSLDLRPYCLNER